MLNFAFHLFFHFVLKPRKTGHYFSDHPYPIFVISFTRANYFGPKFYTQKYVI